VEDDVGRVGTGIERAIGVLVACWCLIPVFIVFGFLFWASIEAPWAWKPVFVAALLAVFVGFVVWGGALCAQCRRRRET
jgi:hypothetical protein